MMQITAPTSSQIASDFRLGQRMHRQVNDECGVCGGAGILLVTAIVTVPRTMPWVSAVAHASPTSMRFAICEMMQITNRRVSL